MKKNLLFAAALMTAFCASAGVEVGFMDAEAFELGNKPTLPAGTVLSKTENVEMVTCIEDETSSQNPAFNGFKYLIVDGETVAITSGIGGSTNGKGDLVTAPSGWTYQFNVKKDGWLIVVSKISSNKNFYAFEGAFGGGKAISYTLGMDIQSSAYPEVTEAIYTIPADAMGYVDMAAADIDDYTGGTNALMWPIRIATKNPEAETAGNGTGVMIFPVYADAESYMCLATGSKMNTCGYIFVDKDPEGEAPAVTLYCPAVEGENPRAEKAIAVTGAVQTPNIDAGIDNIIVDAAANENAPMYNVLGQRVNESYKGLVIKNGVKFINK
ncbi:MAG: hypothetical protein NC098_01555 [Lachnoclostridium sp.]|nr:hypothetical protein [Lachnoclostridium sp.]